MGMVCTSRGAGAALVRSAACTAIMLAAGSASAQLRVAAWNISQYDGADRAAALQTSVYTAFNGRSFAPDVISLQEIGSAAALATLVNVLNTAPGSPGDWAAAPFVTGPDWENTLIYRTSKLDFVRIAMASAGSSSDLTLPPRDTFRYDLRLDGYGDIPTNHIAIYSTHMKAGATNSGSTSDQARRLVEATRIRDNAEGVDTGGVGTGMPAGYHFIIAGDFNVQSSSQLAYQELVGSQIDNTGRFFDPINSPGSWNNNSVFRFIHTQDPSGAGGMDDRLDIILASIGLMDGAGLDYIGNAAIPYSTSTWNDPNHSYRCWGNDGTSFNLALTTTGNTMVGPVVAQALIDVADSAGHLPLFMDFRVPAKITSNVTTLDFGTVIQNTAAPSRQLQVSNAGNVALWNAAGIANLSYTLPAAAGFTVPSGNYADAAGGLVNTHTLTMPTTTVGIKNTTITITSNDPDQPTRVIQLLGTVVANLPPVANAGPDQTVTDSDNSGSELVLLDGSASNDPDSGGIIEYRWSEGATVLSLSTMPTANVSLAVGVHDLTLRVIDTLGAVATDTVRITVEAPVPGCVSTCDFNQDGGGDTTDVLELADAIASGTDPYPGSCLDYNQDGGADTTDVVELADAIASGTCP